MSSCSCQSMADTGAGDVHSDTSDHQPTHPKTNQNKYDTVQVTSLPVGTDQVGKMCPDHHPKTWWMPQPPFPVTAAFGLVIRWVCRQHMEGKLGGSKVCLPRL